MITDRPRQIAFYGKGGIGKSTTVANVSSALVSKGHKLLQVGCDPKHDSSRPFWNGKAPRTIIDLLREGRGDPVPSQYVSSSPSGVHFLEAGGPEPGVGCAGRGILKMFELLEEAKVLQSGYDVVLYDVLGDVVCGGFAAPLRAGYAHEVYVVLSGEFMALYAANNICRGIATYAQRRNVRLGGFVLNRRNTPNEVEVANDFARAVGSHVVAVIPRERLVAEAEQMRRTVVEAFPDSPQAAVYQSFADTMLLAEHLDIPAPLTDEALEELYFRSSARAAATVASEP